MPATPPLTAEALQVLAAAFLATSSPKRLRRMREAVETACCCRKGPRATPIKSELHAAHEAVIDALHVAEFEALRRRA